MVTGKRLFTSFFYRKVVLFFSGAGVLMCVEIRDLYNAIFGAPISACCTEDVSEDVFEPVNAVSGCSLQVCADMGLFQCNDVANSLMTIDYNVAFEFLRNEMWFWALIGMFIAMVTTIIIMSIEAFHMQHYCYKLLSYRIYVCMESSLTRWGTTSLVLMIIVVELVYDVVRENLIYAFQSSLHTIERCGEHVNVLVGPGRTVGDRFDWMSVVANFLGPFFLFLVIWRMVVGQVFEVVQDPYASLGLSSYFVGLKSDRPENVLARFTKISQHKLEILFKEFSQKHKRRSMTNAWWAFGPHIEFLDSSKMDELVHYVMTEGRRRGYFRTLHSQRTADPFSGELTIGLSRKNPAAIHHPFSLAGEKINSSVGIPSPASLRRGDSSGSTYSNGSTSSQSASLWV